MKVISVINQKGGVGKTTTTIELASCFSILKYKTLVIDLDQQCNASKYVNADMSKPDIFKVLNVECSIAEAIQTIPLNKDASIDFIIASEALSKADRKFTDFDDIYLLHDVVEAIKDDYDYIFIDNCPSRSIMMTMSYYASDYIVTPTDCDEGSVDGIDKIYSDIMALRNSKHSTISAKMLAIILNKYEKTSMHQAAYEDLIAAAKNNADNPKVYIVRKSIVASECKTFRESMQVYKPDSNPAIDYMNIAKDIIKKERTKKNGNK